MKRAIYLFIYFWKTQYLAQELTNLRG